MRTPTIITTAALAALLMPPLLCACDDGHIDDPYYIGPSDTRTVRLDGTFSQADTWTGNYTVVAACFDGESPYSLTQAPLPTGSGTLVLSNVPATARTVEIAVVSTLRKRVATIRSYALSEASRTHDTLTIDAGTLDVSIFETINQAVFQANNCSRCHGSQSPAAGLDLTPSAALRSLVGVPSTTDTTKVRVLPGNAAGSYLYQVITDGDPRISYSHPALFTNEAYSPFVDIIRNWINSMDKV